MKNILGILGGMGVGASIDLQRRIFEKKIAEKDQDHIPSLVFNNTMVPDRTKSLLEGSGQDVEDALLYSCQVLSELCPIIAMPCNTAHYWINKLKEVTDKNQSTIVSMIEETINYCEKRSDIKRVVVLSTLGTSMMGLYSKELKNSSITEMILSESQQQRVMVAITKIKAGVTEKEKLTDYYDLLQSISKVGVDGVILGCTELSLVALPGNVNFIDPLDILADSVIRIWQDLTNQLELEKT